MEIKQYAPVYIPTLNRFEHFKRCLESLERCSGADKTDVYVGLDYPPSDKYVEGWKKIDAYLDEKEKNNGFNNLIVRRRDHNCGVGTPTSNSSLLAKEVRAISDRYILTEDDNEFAPNFLEYVNWGLEEYRDDPSIFAICSCKNIETSDIRNNVYKLNTIFNAWGYGGWFDKQDKKLRFRNHEVFKKILKSSSIFDAFSPKVTTLVSLAYQVAVKSFHGDVLVSLLPENERWCIFPKVNKVRNWGWDGTGTHGGTPDAFKKYSSFPLDTDEHFEPIIVEDLYNLVVFERFKEKYRTSKKTYVRAAITFLCYKLTGYIPVSNKKSKWLKVKLLKVQ